MTVLRSVVLRPGELSAALPTLLARGPLTLEVGPGDGRFWPAHNGSGAVGSGAAGGGAAPPYLGAELSGTSMQKAARRLREAGMDSAHLVRLPAETLLRVLPPESLARVYVNFPDPWPKKGHEDERFLRRPTFALLGSRLVPGGEVWLTTDHAEYLAYAVAQARAAGFAAHQAAPPPAALQTKYALKWAELGLSPGHVRLARPDTALHPAPWLPENPVMPHSVLRLPAEPFADFAKRHAPIPGGSVVLLDAYRSPRRGEWVVLAHVEEDELVQEVLVTVTHREDGSTLVRLSRFGAPLMTPGIKAAVGTVTALLEEGGAEVLHRAY